MAFVTNTSDDDQGITNAKGKVVTIKPSESVQIDLPDDAQEGEHFTFIHGDLEN